MLTRLLDDTKVHMFVTQCYIAYPEPKYQYSPKYLTGITQLKSLIG